MSVRDRCTIFFRGTRVEIFQPSSPHSSPQANARNARDVRRNGALMKNPARFQQKGIRKTRGKKMHQVLQSRFYAMFHFTYFLSLSFFFKLQLGIVTGDLIKRSLNRIISNTISASGAISETPL